LSSSQTVPMKGRQRILPVRSGQVVYNVIALGVKAVPICWEYKQTLRTVALRQKLSSVICAIFSPTYKFLTRHRSAPK
jgi:hypothetical protein